MYNAEKLKILENFDIDSIQQTYYVRDGRKMHKV